MVKTLAILVAILGVASNAGAGWIIPTGVVSASGGPYAGDAAYSADKVIDNNLATFCVLYDDSLTGSDQNTSPAYAAAPTTGHILFNLGGSYQLDGVKIIGRGDTGCYNPKEVEFYRSDAGDADLGLLGSHVYSGLELGASESFSWTSAATQFVGMRVKSSYEENQAGLGYYNYQFAEIRFSAIPEPASIFIMATGLVGVLAYAWRKRR